MPHRARAAWLLAAAQAASAFYLPGVAPREYGPGERVELKVGRRPRALLHRPPSSSSPSSTAPLRSRLQFCARR